jgi:hypothetical protein
LEINNFENVVGLIPTADVMEGKFVTIVPHTHTSDFGSKEDVMGCKVPTTAAEAAGAKYCITWTPDNQATPFYETLPTLDNTFATRGGWSAGANMPLSATIYMTHHSSGPESQTIPSGRASLGYTHGVFTLPSGCYVDSAAIKLTGAYLRVAYDAGNEGKLVQDNDYDIQVIGITEDYDATTKKLTVRIY